MEMSLLLLGAFGFLGISYALDFSQSDAVVSLPGYGPPKTKHFAGFSDATPDGKNKLFYYFVEADVGSSSVSTPFLLWFNGGPGASSMIGMFAENLGPHKITVNGSLLDNPDSITKKYHLMAIDNPVGAGFATTADGAYVRSEEEMRAQVVHALRGFFKMHPEYKSNPLWVMGESYAGKYVPNIGYAIAVNATEIPLQGIIVGNGIYDVRTQVQTVGTLAFGQGVIDDNLLSEVRRRQDECIAKIDAKWVLAGDFCENITVRWLYTGKDAAAGELFYYDFGISDAGEFDVITESLGKYLNSPKVKEALHVPNATWYCQDEEGPVADALRADFTIPSTPAVIALLQMGKQVSMYNGVRDGSVCNHIGNLEVLNALDWAGNDEFRASDNVPWPSIQNVMGHIRHARNLRFATVMRTGHLVPTIVPQSFHILLDMFLGPDETSAILV